MNDYILRGINNFIQYMKDTWLLKVIALMILGIAALYNCVIFRGELDNPSGFLGMVAAVLFVIRL